MAHSEPGDKPALVRVVVPLGPPLSHQTAARFPDLGVLKRHHRFAYRRYLRLVELQSQMIVLEPNVDTKLTDKFEDALVRFARHYPVGSPDRDLLSESECIRMWRLCSRYEALDLRQPAPPPRTQGETTARRPSLGRDPRGPAAPRAS